MSLTHSAVVGAKPQEKPYKLYDEQGLFLLVKPKRRPSLALQISLRRHREAARARCLPPTSRSHSRVIDEMTHGSWWPITSIPSAKRRAEKSAEADTFAAIAKEWLETKRAPCPRAPGTAITISSSISSGRTWAVGRSPRSKHPSSWWS